MHPCSHGPCFYLYMYSVCLDVLKDGYVNPVQVSMQHVHLLFDFVGVWPLVTLNCCCAVIIAAMRGEKVVCCAARVPDLQV